MQADQQMMEYRGPLVKKWSAYFSVAEAMRLSAAVCDKFKSRDLRKEKASASSQLGSSGISYGRSSRRDHALAIKAHAKTIPLKGSSAKTSVVCKFLILPTEIRLIIYRHVFELPRCVHLHSSDPYRNFLDPTNIVVHTGILQTRRQIYQEAAGVLYSELTIKLVSGNNLALGIPVPPLDEREPGKLYDNVWRHNPLDGMGYRMPDGTRLYDTPKMDGLMEPHVFARFQNLELDVRLEYEARPLFFIGEDRLSGNICVKTIHREADFMSSMQQARIIHDVVKLVSSSPCIKKLLIRLTGDVGVIWLDGRERGQWREYYWKEVYENIDVVAALRATELMVDSGMLSPLSKLSNVKWFGLEIRMGGAIEKKTL